jgi:hypothetical protein
MQLTASRVGLACALVVGVARAQPPAAGAEAPLDDTAPAVPSSPYVVHASSEVAEYADTDHVFVFTPTVAGSVERPGGGWSVNGSYLVDVISAASVDIVSTASRRWTEVRQGGTLGGAYQLGALGVAANGVVSSEPDYLSLAAGLVLTYDLLDKNVTLLAAYDHGHDIAGRTGTPFSVFSHAINLDNVNAGATFVLDRATIATALVDADFVNGDTSKPYRYIPLFAPGTHVSPGASIDTVNALRVTQRPLEQLPLTRNRYALTFRVAHRFDASTLRLEERLYDDTWALKATTTDARLLYDLSRRVELGPHLRAHAQTSVNFWELAYVLQPGLVYPAYRTGDRELGPLVTGTGGGTLRWGVGPSRAPMQWVLGLDLSATYTRFLDDLYVTNRTSVLGGLSIEAEL